MRRNAGRVLLTLADLITIAAPIAADLNGSHLFNERWPRHARFHGVVALAMASALSVFAIWRLWTPSTDRGSGRAIAAAVPLAYWGPFFPAVWFPGAGVDDAPHPVARVAGIPTNLLGAAATGATAIAGWLLDRSLRPA
ncbi:MAG: hypothetical protein J2P38_09285 [Candidatus Dormibacteraeota bacterium]|nr:hypothetical protein [Candidatus Dormibacteraeota bacterium]